MNHKVIPVFVDGCPRLPLVNEDGRIFSGLKNSSSPELVDRVKFLFEYLNERLGFSDSEEGYMDSFGLDGVYSKEEIEDDLMTLTFI